MTLYQELQATIEADQWPNDPDECVRWQHSKTWGGYGHMKADGSMQLTHRVAYCIANGFSIDDIDGWMVLHSCDVRDCMRSSHLRLGKAADNMRDMVEHGRNNNSNKTQCPVGHEYDEKNTYVDSKGKRACCECRRDVVRARRAALSDEEKEAVNAKRRAVRAAIARTRRTSYDKH